MLAGTVDDAASGGIVWADGNRHPVPEHDADPESSHLAREMCEDVESIVCFDFEESARQYFGDDSVHFDMIFL